MKGTKEDSEKPMREERAAMLLIHGIGEQSPYETLDKFTRGLLRYQLKENKAEKINPTLTAFTTGIKDVSAVSVRLTGLPFKSFDLYEYYWADKVQGRITWYKSLWFLIRTGFASLNFRKQLPMLLESSSGNGKRRSPLAVIAQEIATALLLLFVMALLVTLVVIVGARSPEVLRAAREFGGDLAVTFRGVPWTRGVLGTLFLLFGTVWVYLILNVVQERLESWRIAARHKESGAAWRGMSANTQWLPYSLVVFSIVSLVQALLLVFVQKDVEAILGIIGAFLKTPGIVWSVALILLGVALRWFLVYYIGDIILYVTTDPKSPHYETRCTIRDTCSDTLRTLLKKDYDVVYLLGHSLGSVIAYDALDELAKDIRLETKGNRDLTEKAVKKLGIDKLKGLLTFGSPLDKVFYFFRTDVSDEQAVRSQLLSYVYSSRKRKSQRDYGSYKFEAYESYFQNLYWLNLYSSMDIISGHLDFYNVDKQHAMGFWNPFLAHGEYWQSLDFYKHVNSWLVKAKLGKDNEPHEIQQGDATNQEARLKENYVNSIGD